MDYRPNDPWQGYTPYTPPAPKDPISVRTRELIFAGLMLIFGMALCNSVLYGGFNLGFAVCSVAITLCSGIYLLSGGYKLTPYSATLLTLSLVLSAAFARSDDGGMKCTMLLLMPTAANLSLCLTAKKNRRDPGSANSLLDAPRAFFRFGFGSLGESFRGFGVAFRSGGSALKKGGGFLLGLCITVPIVAIVIPLLTSADAAFDGLISLLPEFQVQELVVTLIFGCFVCPVLYTRSVALGHVSPDQPEKQKTPKKLGAITVNTVLCGVGFVYAVYLLSQLAYIAGGFAGILPEGYSTAEYARRGFFEMALLCAINLSIISLGLYFVKKEGRAPFSTRLLCLFIGIVTLFLVASASAKMFLYIGTYGLTYLRVSTQIFTVFMGVVTILVMVWLFVPKFPYMKAVVITALVICAVTVWADIDTQVARYNVDAYLSGRMETVDVAYLDTLSGGAVKHMVRLAREAPDTQVRTAARRMLEQRYTYDLDFREWNYAKAAEIRCLQEYFAEPGD